MTCWWLQVAVPVFAFLTTARDVTAIKSLSLARPEELKEVFSGGDCWVVACTDVNDNGAGRTLLQSAKLGDSGSGCTAAELKCKEKLESSGKTVLQRLGLSAPPKTHPLLLLASNGDPPRALKLEEYAKISDSGDSGESKKEDKRDKKKGKKSKKKEKASGGGVTATPDARVLAASVTKAGAPYKAVTVTSDSAFQSRCTAQRHCLVLVHNSSYSPSDHAGGEGEENAGREENIGGDAAAVASVSASGSKALNALAETLARKHRRARVVVLDLASAQKSGGSHGDGDDGGSGGGGGLEFTLAAALPLETAWPTAAGGAHGFPAPRPLYLRSLNAKERAALLRAHTPEPPPAIDPTSDLLFFGGDDGGDGGGDTDMQRSKKQAGGGGGGESSSSLPLLKGVAVSKCPRTEIATAPNATVAAGLFEAQKVSARQWKALVGNWALNQAPSSTLTSPEQVEVEDLVFAVDGQYYSWGAAAGTVLARGLFSNPGASSITDSASSSGSSSKAIPDAGTMAALAEKFPLFDTALQRTPKWGARAFRTTSAVSSSFSLPPSSSRSRSRSKVSAVSKVIFSARAVDEWLGKLIDQNVLLLSNKDDGDVEKALTPLFVAPRILVKGKNRSNKNRKGSGTERTKNKKQSSSGGGSGGGSSASSKAKRPNEPSPSPSSSPSTRKSGRSSSGGGGAVSAVVSGAEARRRRLAGAAKAKERAAREAAARRKMDQEMADFVPQSATDDDEYDDDEDENDGGDSSYEDDYDDLDFDEDESDDNDDGDDNDEEEKEGGDLFGDFDSNDEMEVNNDGNALPRRRRGWRPKASLDYHDDDLYDGDDNNEDDDVDDEDIIEL